jgi:hypothetical protein
VSHTQVAVLTLVVEKDCVLYEVRTEAQETVLIIECVFCMVYELSVSKRSMQHVRVIQHATRWQDCDR